MAEQKAVLGYYNLRGLAQPLRFMLHYLEFPHEERVLTYDEWYGQVKGTLDHPFPNVPYFIAEGKTYTESDSIFYLIPHLAKRDELNGSNPEEKILITQQYSVLREIKDNLSTTIYSERWKEIIGQQFTKIKPKLETFNKILNGKKWLLGDNVCRADFLAYETFKQTFAMYPEDSKHLNELQAYNKRFEEIPQIKKYLESDIYKQTSQRFGNPPHAKLDLPLW